MLYGYNKKILNITMIFSNTLDLELKKLYLKGIFFHKDFLNIK